MEENKLFPHKDKLLLRNKYIKSYDDFIKELSNILKSDQIKLIQYLDVNRNYLNDTHLARILSEDIFDNKRFISINLTANDLINIPKEIGMCINLEKLVLNNNKIKKIENLENLSLLKHLELRSNRIDIWENLEKLTNLVFLTLSTNLIRHIDSLSIHEHLIELGVFGNYLGNDNNEEQNRLIFEDLLKQISKRMPKLKRLFMGGNHFYKISSIRNDYIDYKDIIKEHITSLEYLDGEIL